MPTSPAHPTTEQHEDPQRLVRRFVSDLVTSTIGATPMDAWIGRAIFEKLQQDITSFYPAPDPEEVSQVDKIWSMSPAEYSGVLYLKRHAGIICVKTEKRRMIDMIRAAPDLHPDRQSAQKIARDVAASGLECISASVLYIPIDSNRESDIWMEHYPLQLDDTPLRPSITKTFAFGLMTATITQSSSRDVQKLPGPSDLADPCDLCVARKIAASCGLDMEQIPRTFSLKAWVGTSIHQKLERDLPIVYPHAQQEITVPIEAIQGIGAIKGHVDAYLPEKLTMGDWKSTDKKKLDFIRAHGVSASHFGQTMLYMYGLKKKGLACDYATLTYIPRDSRKVSDIWVASCAYREDVAVGLLNRTRDLYERLKSGRLDGITPADGCFVCTVQPFLRN